jgi:hypothetical protein
MKTRTILGLVGVVFLSLNILLGAVQSLRTGNENKRSDTATETNSGKKEKPQKTPPPAVTINETFYGGDSEQKNQKVASEGNKQPHDWIESLNAYSTLTIAIFTVLLFVGSILQFLGYQATERAWILASIHQPVKTGSGVYVIPIIKNHGKTTARITRFALSWRAVNSPDALPSEPDYGRENEADFVVPPNAPIQPMSVLIPNEDYRDAEEIRIALYVYGFIDYKAWWIPRKTRFCFMHYPGPSTTPLPPGFYVGIQAPSSYTKTT